MLYVEKQGDARRVKAITHRLADIPNGGTISILDFSQSQVFEGQPVGLGADGFFHIIKGAEVVENASSSATTYIVKKGHNFKVGEFVCLKEGAKSYAITSISTNADNSNCDDIVIGTTLGVAIKKGDTLSQAKAESSSASALIFEPIGIVGTSHEIKPNSNLFVDIVTMGQAKKCNCPFVGNAVASALKHINFI